MAKEFARNFYKSKAWRTARRAALSRTGGLCQWCLEKGEIVPADEVHHTVELSAANITDEDIALNPDLLIPLCHRCHDSTKHTRQHQPRYTVNADGVVETFDEQPPDEPTSRNSPPPSEF